MKQTLEEAAIESCVIDRSIYNDEYQPYYLDGFKDGAEWYQMERLLVAISLFHPGDRHTLRQTEDLNLRIGTTTNVTCGCPSRLSMKY